MINYRGILMYEGIRKFNGRIARHVVPINTGIKMEKIIPRRYRSVRLHDRTRFKRLIKHYGPRIDELETNSKCEKVKVFHGVTSFHY